ncbi:MAG TPA: hypothetical protein PK514_03185 [Spirochaetota bacterium]|nr:hypothetical protein [Spirochaetota bacterium]
MNNRTLIIKAKKHTGAITPLASFFSRRNIAVEKMSCFALRGAGEMVFTVTYARTEGGDNFVPHLSKMYDVIEAYYREPLERMG